MATNDGHASDYDKPKKGAKVTKRKVVKKKKAPKVRLGVHIALARVCACVYECV